MSGSWVRALVGVVVFFVVLVIGVNVTGSLDAGTDLKNAANKVVATVIVALVIAFIAYAVVEYAQTNRLESITSQFDTRTIVLIPIAIAINIILGQTVAAALKVPVYLDSIGTILVGVMAGPLAGALTGGLANLIWTYVLPAPFHSDYAAPFFIVAVEIGLLAGIFGRLGFFRSRPNTPPQRLAIGAVLVAIIVAVIGIYGFLPFYTDSKTNIFQLFFFAPPAEGVPAPDPILVILGWLVALLLIGAVVGLIALLAIRRDLGAAYVFVAGIVCGIVSAIISAPISAVFFGGVTGSGTDVLVAAFQKAGSDLGTAVLKQGLLSDPIDKTVTFFIVFAILGALSRRFVSRFPQGEQAVGLAEA
ncbi:MAG TPA: ECF transporter S component [Candidatus Limnocylindrales bacterium]|jgi:energy-coupling factor transport system substrate-specific component